jgi:ATP-dependent Lon protease
LIARLRSERGKNALAKALVVPALGILNALPQVDAATFTGGEIENPARNRRDFDEIPQGARDKLELIWLERVDDAVAAAFEESPHAVAAAM